MDLLGTFWIGLKFKYPLIWLLVKGACYTQEPTAEMEHPMGSDLGADTQEPTNKNVVTQEPVVEAETTQG